MYIFARHNLTGILILITRYFILCVRKMIDTGLVSSMIAHNKRPLLLNGIPNIVLTESHYRNCSLTNQAIGK